MLGVADVDLMVNRRPPSFQSETPLAAPTPMPPASYLHSSTPAKSPDPLFFEPFSKAAVPSTFAKHSKSDITCETNDGVEAPGNLAVLSDSSTAVSAVDPEDDACSVSLAVTGSSTVVLTVMPKQQAADNMHVLLPPINDVSQLHAENAGMTQWACLMADFL